MSELTTEQRALIVRLTELALEEHPVELETFRLVSGSLVDMSLRRSAEDHADDVLFFDGIASAISEIIVGIIVAICSDLLKAKIAITASSIRRAFEKRKAALRAGKKSPQIQLAVDALEKALEKDPDAESRPANGARPEAEESRI